MDKIITNKSLPEIALIAVLAGYLLMLYLLATVGCWRLFRDRRYLLILLFSGITLYFLLALAPAAFTAKYRLPLIPIMALLAGNGIHWLWRQKQNKHFSPPGR